MIYELLEKVAPKSTTTITSSDSLSYDSLSIDGTDLIAEIYNRYGDDNVESDNSETDSDKIKNSIKELQNKLSDNGIIQVCYIKKTKIGDPIPKNRSLLINKNENDITVNYIKEEIGEVSAFAEILRYCPKLKKPAEVAVRIADILRYRLAKSNKDNNIFVKSSIDDYADFHSKIFQL